jgi:hypothetical protein
MNLHPARKPNETQPHYVARRAYENLKVELYLAGRFVRDPLKLTVSHTDGGTPRKRARLHFLDEILKAADR